MAETITAIIDIDVDLDSGAKPVPLSMQLVYGNQRAHTFRVRAYREGKQVYMSGAQAIGYVRRADGTTIELTGVVSLDMVEVTLTEACYAVTGLATISIDLVIGNVIATCMVATAQVDNVKSDYAVSPGSGGGTVVVTGAVRYDITQVLTEDQKARARANIGAGTGGESGGSIAGAVRFDIAQGLEDDQKAQARANIGVTSTGADISGIIDDTITAPDKAWSSSKTAARIYDMMGIWNADYEGLNDIIGEPTELNTDTKTDLVSAINEVNAKVGSGTGGSSGGGTSSSGPVTIECWGDSLTEGYSAGSKNYPNLLQAKTGLTVMNYGVGSENCETILARMGATLMYVHDITIPANGAVVISKDKLRSATGEIVPLLKQGTDRTVNKFTVNDVETYLTIDGIAGTLTCNYLNTEKTDWEYIFVRKYPGNEKKITTPVEVVSAYANSDPGNIVRVIWMGQNDIVDEDMSNNMAQLGQYLIEACRAAVRGVDKYIILTSPVSTGATATPYKPIHRAMVHAFGAHCISIVDYLIRYGLTDANQPVTDQDNTDMAAYYIPASLRSDRVHLNEYGYQVVANQVYKRGQLLGYWT